MQILKAYTYNLKKSRPFYLLYEESYNSLKLTYFSRTRPFTFDAHCMCVGERWGMGVSNIKMHTAWWGEGLSSMSSFQGTATKQNVVVGGEKMRVGRIRGPPLPHSRLIGGFPINSYIKLVSIIWCWCTDNGLPALDCTRIKG